MKWLLTLKAWKLFMLMIGILLIYDFIMMGSMVAGRYDVIIMFPLIMGISMFTFFGWFYALAINLHKKLPAIVTMSLTKFKIFLFAPIVYICILMIFIATSFKGGAKTIDPAAFAVSFGIIFPIHIFSMFCVFYCLYFVAKELKSVEWQKPVTFSDFAGEFFLIWFFPVGIWIIQPRINKLFEEETGEFNQQIN